LKHRESIYFSGDKYVKMVPHKRRVTHSHKRSIKCTVKSLAHMKPAGELQIKQLFNV